MGIATKQQGTWKRKLPNDTTGFWIIRTMGFMFLFFSGRLFKPLERSLNGLFHLSCFWCRRETWHRGFAWAVFLPHPLFLITGSHSGGFLIRVTCVCLVKSPPEAALFFMAEGLGWRPEPGSWQDGMDPAEDGSCHGPSRHGRSFRDTTKEHWAVASAHPPSGHGAGEAWCKEHWGPWSSSSVGLEVTWLLNIPAFSPSSHPHMCPFIAFGNIAVDFSWLYLCQIFNRVV